MTALSLRARLAATLLTLGLLAGCYVPSPVTHARLHLTDAGHCTLDAQPLALRDLAAALAQRQASAPKMVLELHIGPDSDQDGIRQVVEAARQAQVRVAFVNEAQSCSASSPTEGCKG